MTAFEDFVNTELPQRPVLIKGATEATGDPRLSALPKVQGAPIGTLYLQYGTVDKWERTGPDAADWIKRPSGRVNPEASNYIIYVNPVTGDDDPSNDGRETPLATIDAAFARIPIDVNGGVIQLSADTFDLGNIRKDWALPRNWNVYGWYDPDSGIDDCWGWPKLTTFIPTSESGWTVSKDSGTTPWTTDEFVGKFLFMSTYGGSWIHRPIVANDAHSITTADYWGSYDVGVAAYVAEPQTIITNSGNYITFVCDNSSTFLWGFVFNNCNVSVSDCKGQFSLCVFKNNYFGIQLYFGGDPSIYDCVFMNNSSHGINLYTNAASVYSCAFINNSGHGVYFASTPYYCWTYDLAFRGIASNKYGIVVDWSYNADISGDYYFNSVGRFCLSNSPSNKVYFSTAITGIGGTKPTSYGFVAVAGSTTYLKSTYAIEAVTAANSFSINGRLVSLTDMIGKYQRNYFAPGNTSVLAF